MSPPKPPFDALPLRKDGPPGNAWGCFGDDDQCGMLNLLTPETTVLAAREIVEGLRISTDWPLNRMKIPCFSRAPLQHTIKPKTPRTVNDDILTFNTQSSSQWDGFRHFGYQKEQIFYGGHTLVQLLNSNAIGTDAWLAKGGIVGRGVLLDFAGWAEDKGLTPEMFAPTSISVDTLLEVAASQGISPSDFRPGDILFTRTGWIRAYESLSNEARVALAAKTVPPAIGIESSEKTLRWIWDTGFAAVAGDQPSFEAWPCQSSTHWLHEWLLAGWGVPIGELFDLEKLSRVCRERKRWTFFFSSMPLKVPGGVASPPNGVAIL